MMFKETDLMNWSEDCPDLWVIFGDHLNIDEAIRRHGIEYLNETHKEITGLIWKYARREFTDDGEGQQAWFLYKKKVKGCTVPVTIIDSRGYVPFTQCHSVCPSCQKKIITGERS